MGGQTKLLDLRVKLLRSGRIKQIAKKEEKRNETKLGRNKYEAVSEPFLNTSPTVLILIPILGFELVCLNIISCPL